MLVQGFGGGGSGGGGSNGITGTTGQWGGGGGAGSILSSAWITVVPGTTYTITIGPGGASVPQLLDGIPGGDTSFGSLVVFSGASGGQAGIGTSGSLSGQPSKNNSNTNQFCSKWSLTAGGSIATIASGVDGANPGVTGSQNILSTGNATLYSGGASGSNGTSTASNAGGTVGGPGGAGPGGAGGIGGNGGTGIDGTTGGAAVPPAFPAANTGAGGGGGGAGGCGTTGGGTGGNSGAGGSGSCKIFWLE